MGNQDPNTYTPDALKFGQTYFWRVDEVNDLHPGTKLWKGDIWTLTTAYPGSGVVLGDWEDTLDGWVKYPDTAKYVTLGYSTNGATLNSKSLKLDIIAGQQAFWILRLYLNAGQLEAFKANDLFSLDVTWVASEWLGHSFSQVQWIAINAESLNWDWRQIDAPISDTSNPGTPGAWTRLSGRLIQGRWSGTTPLFLLLTFALVRGCKLISDRIMIQLLAL